MDIRHATCLLIGFFALGGALALYVALAGADWFFRSAGVRALTGKTGKNTARLIYGLIGAAILAVAVVMALSIV